MPDLYDLQINRDGKPFKEAIDKRMAIDKAAKRLDMPVAEGDVVVCAHGTGTLVACDGPDDPCIVEVEIGDVKQDSLFDSMVGNDEGNGRVRRPPILFSHGARKGRKDQITDNLRGKVSGRCSMQCMQLMSVSCRCKHTLKSLVRLVHARRIKCGKGWGLGSTSVLNS